MSVHGKLAVNGQPYDPQTQEEVMMILYPAGEGGTSFPAVVDVDGSFVVPGVDGKGVLPGKYHISLERMSDDRKTKVQVPAELRGSQSKLEREVTADSGDLGTIDVTKAP